MANFTDEMDEKLIELVRTQPVLYNFKLDSYNNNTLKDVIWRSMGTELGRTAYQCKARWRSIRDTYRKIKTTGKHRSCSAVPSKSKYFSNKFAFLDDTLQGRQRNRLPSTQGHTDDESFEHIISGSDLVKEEIDIDENNETLNDLHTEELKRKFEKNDWEEIIQEYGRAIRENNETESNYVSDEGVSYVEIEKFQCKKESPITLFFMSMAKTVEQFPPDLIAETRLKICEIITEIEMKHISRQNS